jgi:hypothetical protein
MKLKAEIQIGSTPLYDVNLTVILLLKPLKEGNNTL